MKTLIAMTLQEVADGGIEKLEAQNAALTSTNNFLIAALVIVCFAAMMTMVYLWANWPKK